MIVCVSEELQYLQEELVKRGYIVVNKQGNGVTCDAIVCNLKDGGLINLNMQSTVRREGTLIIDYGSRSIDEIENILKTRGYSSVLY